MKLSFIGHAGFITEHEDTILIMDPWVSKFGAYDSAWMQFPCNHHLESFVLDKLKIYQHVYIYISHEHKDHFDIDFLHKLISHRPDIVFLIPDFKSKTFLNELQALNPNMIIELPNDAHYHARALDIHLFMDESGINHDSGILVRGGHYQFLNLNDCKIFDRCEYIKNKFGKPDIFTVQFSGASWHPICYEMDEDKYQLISKQKKMSKYRAVLNAIKILNPNRYLPSAGPPALLDPQHYDINFQQNNIFPPQHDVIKFLKSFKLHTKIDAIMPGDVYDFNTDSYVTSSSQRVDEGNFKEVMDKYAKESLYLYETNLQYRPDNLETLFQEYLQHLQAKADLFKINESIQHQLYFGIWELTDKYIHVDLNSKLCDVVTQIPAENYYVVSYPAWQIRKLIEGSTKGEDLALTFRGKMKRSPDIYNTWISCFMNSEQSNMQQNIKLIEAIRENNEKIIVNCNGSRYEIKRFCPHQGADLQYGWCEGNHWVCPKHRWHYNLENGGHCESANATIEAVRLADDDICKSA